MQSQYGFKSSSTQNVGEKERILSMLAGGGLLASSLRPSSSFRLLKLIAGAALAYRGYSGHCELYQRLGVDHSEGQRGGGSASRFGVAANSGRKATTTVHINRDPQELYDHWRNLPNLAEMMQHIDKIEVIDEKRSRWSAQTPLGNTVQWEAEIIGDRPGEMIAWQSLPGSTVSNAGSVHFRRSATGMGTDLEVAIKYDPPGGVVTTTIAHFFGQGLQQEIEEDLRRFKQRMEAGEVATAATH